MAYVFNDEDKVKWSELSPSLQNRFKELEMMKSSLTVSSVDRIETTRLTISRVAPTKPSNNADLWIDEKYRIARAFTENNWEFTRAAWATSGFIPSDPQTSTDIPPSPTGGSSTPVDKSFTFITQIDNPTTGQVSRTYGKEVAGLRDTQFSRVELNPITIYGYNIVMHVSVSASSVSGYVGNLIYLVNNIAYYKKLYVDDNFDVVLTTASTPVAIPFIAEIETACYSLRKNSPIIYPVDTESAYYGIGIESTGYPYPFHVVQYMTATGITESQLQESMMVNMDRGSIGKADPPFIKTGTSNLTITISFDYTTYA